MKALLRRLMSSRMSSVLVSAGVTVAVLFGLQYWYLTYNELAWLQIVPTTPLAAEQRTAAEEQRARLRAGPLPIEAAMQKIASTPRQGIATVLPEASTDPAPAAGWMHMPGYVAPPAPLPPEPAPEPVPAEGEVAPGEGDAPPAEGEAAPPSAVEANAPAAAAPAPAPAPAAAPAPAPAAAPAPAVPAPVVVPAPAPGGAGSAQDGR